MNFDDAITQHSVWKTTLSVAIATGTELDVKAIASDRRCALGRRLHGDAAAKNISQQDRAACIGLHANFHKEAARVASLINHERLDDASQLLREGSVFAEASSDLVAMLRELRLKSEP